MPSRDGPATTSLTDTQQEGLGWLQLPAPHTMIRKPRRQPLTPIHPPGHCQHVECRLAHQLSRLSVTQREAAQAMGVTQGSVNRWVTGKGLVQLRLQRRVGEYVDGLEGEDG